MRYKIESVLCKRTLASCHSSTPRVTMKAVQSSAACLLVLLVGLSAADQISAGLDSQDGVNSKQQTEGANNANGKSLTVFQYASNQPNGKMTAYSHHDDKDNKMDKNKFEVDGRIPSVDSLPMKRVTLSRTLRSASSKQSSIAPRRTTMAPARRTTKSQRQSTWSPLRTTRGWRRNAGSSAFTVSNRHLILSALSIFMSVYLYHR